ncbi:MAG TPA: recombinase family protein [Rhizomicrobium sp.]|jgi:DNA invertase Pin-like site-specific DNA recombinase
MKQLFAYIRVSTVRQGEHGSSLQEQRAAIDAYARRHELSIVEWFEETETAAKQGRPTFLRMLNGLKRERAQGVIIHKIDRSARNLKDWANLGDLIDQGVEVHFAHESLDLKSRGGRLAADIQAVVAADFIRNLRQEVKKGFYGRLKQGLYPLRAPIGYLDAGRGEKKQIDPVLGPLVRQTFEIYATEGISFETLGQRMYKLGLRNRNGGGVTKNGLTTMLNNPFYFGLIHIRKTNETFEGAHAPLIPKSLYDRVQAILRGERTGTPLVNDFLFRRLVRCAICGYALIGEIQKGRYIYYRCHTKPGCASVSETRIDERWREILPLLALEPEEVGDLRDLVEMHKGSQRQSQDEHAASLNLRLAKCDERLARLTDAVIDGLIDREAFEQRKLAALSEKRAVRDQLEQGGSKRSVSDIVDGYLELANTAEVTYGSDLASEKREVVISLTSNFLGEGNYPVITLKSPFRELVEWRKSTLGEVRRDRPRTRAEKIFEIIKKEADKEWIRIKAGESEPPPRGKKPNLGLQNILEFNGKRKETRDADKREAA